MQQKELEVSLDEINSILSGKKELSAEYCC